MPKTPATPRTTRNSRGLRETTPTSGRRSRESSVSSSDGERAAPTPLRRSRRSRESSVASDSDTQQPPTPRHRSQRSRSRSVEPATSATAAASSSQPTDTPTVESSQPQLPLPPVPATVPATPPAARTSHRNFQGVAAAPPLTPIVEESPIQATPTPIPAINPIWRESAPAHNPSNIVEETASRPDPIAAPVAEESVLRPAHSPTPDHNTSNVEKTVSQPGPTTTPPVAEENATGNPIGLVENPTTPRPLHQVGLAFSLQPVTPLKYLFHIADDELQASIDCDESEKEEEDIDYYWNAVQKARTKARREKKLKYRRDQFRRQFELPEDFSETSHPLIVGEEPGQPTEKYASIKKEEGHAFGGRLLQAIRDDHERRGCECPLPKIYRDRAAAEAGEGTFRFFRNSRQKGLNNIWVFMRKGDWHWHCTCNREPLSDFAVWVRRHYKAEELAEIKAQEQKAREDTAIRQSRKRKAQASESELTDSVAIRVVNGPCQPGAPAVRRKIAVLSARTTTTVSLPGSATSRLRARSARLLRSARFAASRSLRSVKPMCGILSAGAIVMGTSVKHFLSRVGAQLSTVWNFRQAQTAIENRTQGEHGNIVVKRLKGQHYVPITTTEEREAWENSHKTAEPSPFDDYAWFEWTDSPAKYIGENYLRLFRDMGDNIYRDLDDDKVFWGPSEEAIRKRHREGLERLGLRPGGSWDDEEFNLGLSIGLLHHALEKHNVKTYDELTGYMKDSTLQWWKRCSGSLSIIINDVHGNENLIPALKKKFGPKPPKHLHGYWTEEQRDGARLARNFLIRFLWKEEGLNDAMKLAITRTVADLDAVYKQDIPLSLVEFPGKDDKIMPGTFPLDLMEEVRADDMYIQPIYELQAPSREPGSSPKASPVAVASPVAAPPATPLPLLPAKGILKHRSIPFRTPGDSPTVPFLDPPGSPKPNIRFSQDLVSFRSPQHKAPRYAAPKRGKGSRVEKKARPSQKTQELWSMFVNDIRNGRVRQTQLMQKIPLGRPEDQTKGEAGGWRFRRKDPITGEMKLDPPPTKYEEFLDHTREELFKGGWVIGPTTGGPRPPYDGTMAETSVQTQEAHDGSMANEFSPVTPPRKGTKQEVYRPIRFSRLPLKPTSPKPPKTAEDVKRERDLLLHDLEVNMDGELVRPSILLPDSELPIAVKKLDSLNIDRQLQEEALAGVQRHMVELARQVEEEKRRREAEERRKAEEERRRREEEERREAEERRRLQEAAAARSREEERVRDVARRRGALGLRRPSRAIITPLSDEWRARVSGIQHRPEGAQLAATPEGQALTRRDFVEKLLPATAWLNDNVIIGSIQHIGDLVNDRVGATRENPRCATFTSYFWPRLESAGPGSCGRMMRRAGVRKDNFKDIESILIPICSGNHWTLAAVLPQKGAILHMDSLRGGRGNPSVTAKLLEWVKTTLDEGFVASEWSVINIDGPVQTNGWDCGVFTIVNALCLALGLDPRESYAPGQLRSARTMLAAILLNGGFKGEFNLAGV